MRIPGTEVQLYAELKRLDAEKMKRQRKLKSNLAVLLASDKS